MAGEGDTAVETPTAVTDVPVEKKEIIDVKKDEKKDDEKKEKVEKKIKEPLPSVYKKDYEQDVVYLYQFGRTAQIPSMSPFCLKLETWLKMSGIKFETIDHKSKLRSKRGQLPFIEVNGEQIADSEIIIKTLGKRLGCEMDVGLGSEQKTVQHGMMALVDNHMMLAIRYWMVSNADHIIKGYNLNLQTMLSTKIPLAMLILIFKHTFLRRAMKRIKSAGFAGYTPEEMENFAKDDLTALSELLGDKQFFFGMEPHSLDLNVFVQVASLVTVVNDYPCPLRDFLLESTPNLVEHFERMKERAWGEHWDMATGETMDLNPQVPKPEPPVVEPVEESKEKAESEPAEKEKDATEDKKDEEKKE